MYSMMSKDNPTILVVEDEAAIREMLNFSLGRAGFDVFEAADARAAQDMMGAQVPDLVLLDLMTPDMDGWDVYQQIKSDTRTSGIPVMIVTARAQNIDRVIGRQIAKVDDYIVKPFSPKRLLDAVERALQERHTTG